MQKSWRFAALITLVCLPGSSLAAKADSENPPSRLSKPRVRSSFPMRVYTGEVVVQVDANTHVSIAVDAPDEQGITDGFADHVLSFELLRPIPDPLSLRDVSADVEFRPEGVRVLLHSQAKELEFVLDGESPRPRPRKSVYRIQTFSGVAAFYEYSGPVAERVSLEELQQGGSKAVQQFGPYVPPATPGVSGNSCVASCSKTCQGGSCTASCPSGSCAGCECIINYFPHCYCSGG